jgi:hypothetical protein
MQPGRSECPQSCDHRRSNAPFRAHITLLVTVLLEGIEHMVKRLCSSVLWTSFCIRESLR